MIECLCVCVCDERKPIENYIFFLVRCTEEKILSVKSFFIRLRSITISVAFIFLRFSFSLLRFYLCCLHSAHASRKSSSAALICYNGSFMLHWQTKKETNETKIITKTHITHNTTRRSIVICIRLARFLSFCNLCCCRLPMASLFTVLSYFSISIGLFFPRTAHAHI